MVPEVGWPRIQSTDGGAAFWKMTPDGLARVIKDSENFVALWPPNTSSLCEVSSVMGKTTKWSRWLYEICVTNGASGALHPKSNYIRC